jgi:hypothetical protein
MRSEDHEHHQIIHSFIHLAKLPTSHPHYQQFPAYPNPLISPLRYFRTLFWAMHANVVCSYSPFFRNIMLFYI